LKDKEIQEIPEASLAMAVEEKVKSVTRVAETTRSGNVRCFNDYLTTISGEQQNNWLCVFHV